MTEPTEITESKSFKSGFIDRVRGLVNGEGKKVLLVKEQYLVDQFVRLGQEFLLEWWVWVHHRGERLRRYQRAR